MGGYIHGTLRVTSDCNLSKAPEKLAGKGTNPEFTNQSVFPSNSATTTVLPLGDTVRDHGGVCLKVGAISSGPQLLGGCSVCPQNYLGTWVAGKLQRATVARSVHPGSSSEFTIKTVSKEPAKSSKQSHMRKEHPSMLASYNVLEYRRATTLPGCSEKGAGWGGGTVSGVIAEFPSPSPPPQPREVLGTPLTD